MKPTEGPYTMRDPNCKEARDFLDALPQEEAEDLMVRLAEAAQGYVKDPDIFILDIDRHDAINVTVHGSLTYKGEEYPFVLEDGNWNGTVLRHFGEGDWSFEYAPRTIWAVIPITDREHITLAVFDGFCEANKVSETVGAYTYDRRVQPGEAIERHYKDKLAKLGLRLVSQEEHNEWRKRKTGQ